MSDDIIQIPPAAKFIGTCPCGGFIWSTDIVHKATENLKEVYKCVKCKECHAREDIIPF